LQVLIVSLLGHELLVDVEFHNLVRIWLCPPNGTST
jgi:hypothetical protein